jgi:ketosteroid isomerase-like protein
MMSEENIEIARRSIDAYNRRDLDVLRALNHPDVELDWSASMGPDAGVYRGFEAVLRLYAGYFDAFEEIVVEPECFIDAGESVVVPNVSRSRGRNGIEVFARSTFTLTVRDGKLARVRLFQETEQALKAVGLDS